MTDSTPRVALLLRLPPDLKARLAAHAARLGISANAAAVTLIDRALHAEEKKVR
jgi:predicted HicB family RNase H-like nuclease